MPQSEGTGMNPRSGSSVIKDIMCNLEQESLRSGPWDVGRTHTSTANVPAGGEHESLGPHFTFRYVGTPEACCGSLEAMDKCEAIWL